MAGAWASSLSVGALQQMFQKGTDEAPGRTPQVHFQGSLHTILSREIDVTRSASNAHPPYLRRVSLNGQQHTSPKLPDTSFPDQTMIKSSSRDS
jgi:hypothetical protein